MKFMPGNICEAARPAGARAEPPVSSAEEILCGEGSGAVWSEATGLNEHLFVFHALPVRSMAGPVGPEESQASGESCEDGANAPRGRQDLVLQEFRGSFHFVRRVH